MKNKKQLNQTSFLLLITIVLFFVMYAVGCILFKDQGFARTQNFLNLFISNAGLIVIGIGMTVVMITGGIDISVGSFVAMGCMMLAWMMEKGGVGAVPAVIIVLITGIVFGLVQGFLVAYMDIQPFIVTLAGLVALGIHVCYVVAHYVQCIHVGLQAGNTGTHCSCQSHLDSLSFACSDSLTFLRHRRGTAHPASPRTSFRSCPL